jgi:hypothetical protein|tara:strand:- start:3004 stop:3222 length:219 start_codon:yes stop_codon:yes gene_type:complete
MLTEDQIEEMRSIVSSAGAMMIFGRLMEVCGCEWDEDYEEEQEETSEEEGEEESIYEESLDIREDGGFAYLG